MFRTLALAATLGALALPASAASIKVDINGLDAAAAHAKIVAAANTVCRIELHDAGPAQQYYEHQACVDDAVAKVQAQLATTGRTLASL